MTESTAEAPHDAEIQYPIYIARIVLWTGGGEPPEPLLIEIRRNFQHGDNLTIEF